MKGSMVSKKQMFVIATIAAFCCLIVISGSAITAQAKTKPKLSKKTVSIYEQSTYKLKLKHAKASKVKWYSKNTNIAQISKKGTIKAKNLGTTNVYAKYKGKKYYCKVTSKFSQTVAKKNIKITFTKAKYGKLLINITNNNNYTVYTNNFSIGYFNNGSLVDTYNVYPDIPAHGTFHDLAGDLSGKSYDKIKYSYSVDNTSIFKYLGQYVSVTTSKGTDSLKAAVKNKSSHNNLCAGLVVLYYDSNGTLLDIAQSEELFIDSLATAYTDIEFPSDNDYNTIDFASYKVYILEAF